MRKVKASNRDFDPRTLPMTRKQQFLDTLKLRFGTLVFIGLVSLVFFLPLLCAFFFKETNSLLAVANLEKEEAKTVINSTEITAAAIMIPCAAIFSVGLSGVLKIIRRLIWSEPVFLKEDFKQGIKENWKGFVVISLLISLLNLMCTFTRTYLEPTQVFYYIPTIACLVILFPICFVFFFVNVVYSNSVFNNFITSAKILVRSYLINIGFCLIIYGLFVLLNSAISYPFIKYIVAILIIVFVFPILLLMFFEYEIFLFDKFINPYQSVGFVNKGLFKIEDIEKEKKDIAR